MWNELVAEPAVVRHAMLAQLAVAQATGVHLAQMCAVGRVDARSTLARQMAMYLCLLVFAMGPSKVARAFGRDRKTVRHALLRVEELREDHEFDRAMSLLEAGLSGGRE
jgi:chromosomal replication initiation ATPase DnaA